MKRNLKISQILQNKNLKYLGNLLAIICIVFIIKTVIDLEISDTIIRLMVTEWPLIVLIAILWGAFVFINALNWNLILNFLERKKITYAEISDIYVKANIGKYLPGNIMHFVGRNIIGKKHNISQFNMALSTVLEIGLTVFATLVYSVLLIREKFLILFDFINYKYFYILIPAGLCGLILVFLFYREKVLKIIKGIIFPVTQERILKLFIIIFLFFCNFLLMGATFYLSMRYICGIPIEIGMFSIIGIFLFSWLVGYMIPGASGGIGVREFVLLLLFTPFYSEHIILSVIIIHRIITILGDIFSYIGILIIGMIRQKVSQNPGL